MNLVVGFLSWAVLSLVIASFLRFGIQLSFDYDIGIIGPILILQAFIILTLLTKEIVDK